MRLALSLGLVVLLFACALAQESCLSNVDHTLCHLNNGTIGCCPVKGASCCKTGDFCCPRGFTCDTKAQRCTKEALFIPFHMKLEHVDSFPRVGKDILCPDNVTSCKETQTCCLFSGGQYGCCPILDAKCCDDHVHCCPKLYKCNPKQGKCDKSDDYGFLSIPWLKKVPGTKKIEKIENKDVICPDKSQCDEGTSCCLLPSGEFGCCPLQNAICCDDKEHCCPENFTCDTQNGKCNKGDVSLPFYQKIRSLAKKEEFKFESVLCPDGTSQCPDQTTCCVVESGQYACCPLPKAVCCSDKQHCCPAGTECDVKHGRCNRGDVSIPFFAKIDAKPVEKLGSVICPDKTSQCPDGSTCCQLASGQYACCPLPNAVCCENHQHCCPANTKCDTVHSKCIKGDVSFPFFDKIPSKPIKAEKVESVICPDKTSQCPDGSTCCQLASGEYACCPLPNAVCCEDHQHCCPANTKCDTAHSKCIKGDVSFPFFAKFPTKPIEAPKVENVVCPDKTSACPDGASCCLNGDNKYACCPLEKAVCCEDHIHCCPENTKCDVKASKCLKGDVSFPFLAKFPSKQIAEVKVESVICPDKTSQCPDGSTCCQLASGQYACCPLPNAVCCEDHQHCCPANTKCDTVHSKCIKGDVSFPFFDKIPSKPIEKGVVCPDKSQCPDKNTKTEEKQPIIPQKAQAYQNDSSIVCPGGCSFCPSGTTCCVMTSGDYGCCPLPNAVCCEDHLHCCPTNHVCDLTKGCCVAPGAQNEIPFSQKVSAKNLYVAPNLSASIHPKIPDEPVICPDKTSCSPMSTCCKLSSDGDYGCCSHPDAVCCPEPGICCPANNTCAGDKGCIPNKKHFGYVKSGYNTNWHLIEDMATKIEKKTEKMPSFGADLCPGSQVVCSNTSTCCQKPDGNFACCPYNNGVCCGVHGYCCPKGYTCDPKLEACQLNDDSTEKIQKTVYGQIISDIVNKKVPDSDEN